jgi:multidrug resistance efflux pump
MSDQRETDRRLRPDDEQALEEIRRLFARYRRLARHGVVRERERDDAEETRRAGQLAGNSGSSRGSGR